MIQALLDAVKRHHAFDVLQNMVIVFSLIFEQLSLKVKCPFSYYMLNILLFMQGHAQNSFLLLYRHKLTRTENRWQHKNCYALNVLSTARRWFLVHQGWNELAHYNPSLEKRISYLMGRSSCNSTSVFSKKEGKLLISSFLKRSSKWENCHAFLLSSMYTHWFWLEFL